jgi:hypothetical protein
MTTAKHDRTTDMEPNELIVAHTKPAAPLLPRARFRVVDEPIMDVRAEISMSPLPRLKILDAVEGMDVAISAAMSQKGSVMNEKTDDGYIDRRETHLRGSHRVPCKRLKHL